MKQIPGSRKEKKELNKKISWIQKRKEKKETFKKKRMARPPAVRYLYDIGRFTRRSIMVLVILVNIAMLAGFYVFENSFADRISAGVREGYEISKTIHRSDFQVLDPTVMKDDNGDVIRTFTERNFKYLDLQEDDELFQKVSDVTTTIEDDRFYKHKGFDYLGVGVAAANHFVRGHDLRGASTLTAQLVKNTYLTPEQSLDRKISEAVIAQELEKQFTKREILEFYVNDAYYANGNYGMETAAHYYFSKPTKELTHGEIATLISIPNNPTIYDPITNPENTIERRNLILSLLGEKGILSKDSVKKQKEKDIGLDITETRIDNEVSDWAQSLALYSAVEELMRLEGFNFKYWFDTEDEHLEYQEVYNDAYYRNLENIRRGGFVIETSINYDMQNKLQSMVDSHTSHFTAIDEDGYYSKQAPAVVIDNRTNEVVAIVGGRTQEDMGTFNRAFQSAKQPGSAIKPFLSFAPAIESGLATGTVRKDSEIQDGPKNWYGGYRGDMTLRYALEQSVNTVAYNLYQEVGMSYAREKLVDMEFSNLAPQDVYPTLSIGGWTYGTNPLEIARAFNTLTNDGLYYRPNNLKKISSNYRDDIYYDRTEHQPTRVYDSGVGYVTMNMMQTAITDGINGGFAFGYGFEAAKTGSTDDWREQWIVGGTPYYSMAIYIGDNKPAPQNNIETTRTLQGIFTSYMREIHSGLEKVDFHKPNTVVQDGKNYWIRSESDVDPQEARKHAEQQRINTIHERQNDRLSELAYRIQHGLTLNQAIAREKVAEVQISQLEQYQLTSSRDLTEAEKIKKDAQKAVDSVVRANEKSQLNSRLSNAWNSVIAQRNSMEAAERAEKERIELEKREQEKREREEAERQENERKAQEEEEKRKEEDAEREQTESENVSQEPEETNNEDTERTENAVETESNTEESR